MYIICSKKGNKYGIKDTNDGVVEFYTKEQIDVIVRKHKLKIRGYDNGVISVQSSSTKVKKSVKESSFEEIINEFFYLMKKEHAYWDKQVDVDNGYAAVRDWGSWHIPEEAYLDEDDIEEDYDWEVLDIEWMKKLKAIHKDLCNKYPDVVISIYTSEKNWVDLSINRRN